MYNLKMAQHEIKDIKKGIKFILQEKIGSIRILLIKENKYLLRGKTISGEVGLISVIKSPNPQ